MGKDPATPTDHRNEESTMAARHVHADEHGFADGGAIPGSTRATLPTLARRMAGRCRLGRVRAS
jgi:hypothetical protein